MFINLPQIKPKKLIKLNFNQHLSIILSLSLIFPNVTLADIIADRNAPISNQPTILKTPNSAIQVDIVKPSSSGVSMNEYSKFDTSKDGTVLNNSRSGSDTLTGGYIHANPRLSGGTAKLIVNKVNSNKASSLEGNIEIVGDRADLLIANPSGINIDGAHFINSKSTTLTTGEIRYDGNKINSIDVNKGEITINGKGLKDESDYISLISNTAKINANIHANELNIITGNNKVDKDSNILSTNSDDTSNNDDDTTKNNEVTKVSIDSSYLGGMYANKIKLIATKDGVGVNNRGSIVASKSIKISSNGDIINSGDIVSSKEIDIKAKNITNNGTDKKQASIKSKTLDINSNSLNNKNSIIEANSKLTLKTKELINKDSIIGKENNQDSNNNQDINSDNKNNQDTANDNNNQEATKPSSIVVKNSILNDSSKILSNELSLDISGDIKNENSNLDISSINNKLNSIENINSNFIVDKDIDIKLSSLTQDNSKLHLNSNLNIKANDSISNANNSELSSSKSINLSSNNDIKNINSKIVANEDIDISSLLLDNKDSSIISGKNLSIDTNKYTNHGNLQAGESLRLSTKDTINYSGGFYAKSDIFIKTTDDFINNTKLISNKDLNIEAKNILNNSFLHSLNDMSLISSLSLTNLGEIAAKNSLAITSNSLTNKGSNIYSGGVLVINSKDTLNTDKATIYSKGDMVLNTNTLTNKDSSNIISDKTLDIFYDKSNNLDKDTLPNYVKQDSNKALKVDNLSSLIYSGSDMSINSKELNNKSLDELRINPPTTTSGSIDLRNSSQRVISFGVDVNKLRDDIIETYKINNNYKEPSSSYVEEELKKEIISRNEKLYVLDLHKNTKQDGRNIYTKIEFDFTNNRAIVHTSYIRDREKTRRINYTFKKESINQDDLAKFRPSSIISNANTRFLTNTLLNDKSIVFANGDINLKNTNLTNQGLNLNHTLSSNAIYQWTEKGKRKYGGVAGPRKTVTKGGSLGTKQESYTEVGYPAIFAAGGKITGSLTELNNGKTTIGTISSSIPNFIRTDKDIAYKEIHSIDNLFTINSPNPLFIDNHINPTDEKHYYLNTSYIFDENIPNSDYMHNKLAYIYNFRNSLLKNLLFKDNKPLNSSSLIYAGSGISLDIEGNLNNYSDIVSDKFIQIDANSITNYQGDIKAKDELILSVDKDILNLSSNLEGGLVYLNANSIINQTLSKTNSLSHSYGDESFTTIGETSTISSSKGDVILNAKDSIYLVGSDISSNSNIALLARKDIVSDVVKDRGSYHFNFSGGYSKREYEFNKGSNLKANDGTVN
ncbi:MAG: filamentous hemagglutinin N-terminal domain-containing protein [Campylobacteraceae bacterium]|nr:filamentous hemagglutinin N-terminal domain-containing protein [Campylobacteraceae bacterium]